MAVVARKGLSRRIQSTDPVLSRALDGVRDVVELLAADHDVISSSVTALVASAPIPPGASLVVYSGGPGQTLTLPPANALGVNTGAGVIFMNTATVPVTVVPSRGDTVNGGASLSVPAGQQRLISSDGISRWQTLPTSVGVWTDFTQDLGVGLTSGTFDVTGLSGLTTGKNVEVMQTGQPIAAKGGARDEFLFDDIQATGYVVDAATIRVLWNAHAVVTGPYAFAYQVGV